MRWINTCRRAWRGSSPHLHPYSRQPAAALEQGRQQTACRIPPRPPSPLHPQQEAICIPPPPLSCTRALRAQLPCSPVPSHHFAQEAKVTGSGRSLASSGVPHTNPRAHEPRHILHSGVRGRSCSTFLVAPTRPEQRRPTRERPT